jgi:uncharacterized protein YndB with AHSA1/START domain
MTDKRELEFEIAAPQDEVWHALVDPGGLVGWFASDARVKLEPGGEWFVAHGEHSQSATIEEVVPGERVRTGFGQTTTEFVLEGRRGTTILRIVQSGFDEEDAGSLERGWAQYVETLRHYLTRHAGEAADGAYLYAYGSGTVAEARTVLSATLPDSAEVFDEGERTLGARVPALGDGIYRASIEGRDGEPWVWVHLVAYGDGRSRLPEVTSGVERKLARRSLEPERQSGYSSFRQLRGSAGWAFGVRSSREL